MTTVLLPIADGSEEIEAVTIIDVLRRAGVTVNVASAMPNRQEIQAARGTHIVADQLLPQALDQDWDMIVLPGGMPGAQHLSEHQGLVERLKRQLSEGKWVAAICAAPAVVLGRHNLVPRATATCFPGFQDELREHVAEVSEQRVVIDQNVITSQGPGTAMGFALALVEVLTTKEKAQEIAAALLFASHAE